MVQRNSFGMYGGNLHRGGSSPHEGEESGDRRGRGVVLTSRGVGPVREEGVVDAVALPHLRSEPTVSKPSERKESTPYVFQHKR